jgi:hypothetical protein
MFVSETVRAESGQLGFGAAVISAAFYSAGRQK